MSGLARVVATVFVILPCAVATACGGSDAAGGSGPVRLLVFGDPAEIKAYRDLIAAFDEQKPDVAVQLVEASDREDLLARLATSFAGGTPPDLFLINYRFYGQFASKGVLEPLEKRVDDSEVFEVDDFYRQATDAFRWRGMLTCLPQNVSSLVVYYNRDLFRRFGVPEPRAGMGWNEFVFKARQLTRDAQGNSVRGADPDMPTAGATVSAEIYGLGVEPTLIRIAPFVWSNRGELVDSEERPTRFTLDSHAAKVALQEFLDLRRLHGVVPSDTEVEAEDDETRFVNGRLGMLLDSRRLTPTLREAAKFDWDVAPLPILGEPAGILHSDAYCMAKASENKDAAWRFVEFALGPEGERVLARTGRTVPSLKSVAQSEDFLDPDARPRSSRVFLDAIQNIRHVPTVSTWPEIEDAAEGILENGMYLGQPVDKVVEELDRATRPLFARAER